MVRVLFTVFGSRPHLYPLVPLAWAFRAAGHEVRLASTPSWTSDVTCAGLPAVAVGGSPQVSREVRDELARTVFVNQRPWPTDWAANIHRLDRPRLDYLTAVGRYFVAAAAAMVDELVGFARQWRPDAVVYDSFSYAGPAAAAAIGVPAVRHLSGPDSAQRLEFVQPGAVPLPEYVELFARFGAEARTEPAFHVDPTPPSMRVVTPAEVLGMRFVPYNGPGIVPGLLLGHRTRPRICVTWGHTLSSAVGAGGIRPFLQTIETIAALGMDCLVAAPAKDLEEIGPLPDSVRLLAAVPLHLVLPYCDAIVHQGGDGTALTAAVAAVPQVVISVSPESDMCGGRLAAAGAGVYLQGSELRDDPDSSLIIRHALQKVLSEPGFADSAARLREEIESQAAPAEVAERLSGLLAPVPAEPAVVGG